MLDKILLSLKGVSKQYPGVLALDSIDLDIYEGETHALIGENGAGKSTLIKVLAGAIRADEGEFVFDDETYTVMTPAHANQLGISVIYQEFNLMNSLTVAENVFMGRFPMKHGLVDRAEMERRATEIFREMGVDIDPRMVVQDLSVAYMQLVEIAKSLSKNLRLLIMDEPTAPLTTKEVKVLFAIIRKLKQRGVTIIFISHRLNEIFEICDRVTVMRDGKIINTGTVAEITKDDLIRFMVGREISNVYPTRNDIEIGDTILDVKNLSGNGVHDVHFELYKGEVLGFAGLVGAGRTEIMRVLYGADPMESGDVKLNGKPIKIANPAEAVKRKIVLLPEDRKRHGLVLQLPIRQNIALPNLDKIKRNGVLNSKAEKEMTQKEIHDLRIACHSGEQLVGTLSGGNQQKVVLAKWLAADADILIFDEPTRGIDVGAKYEIYLLMNELSKQGKAIIMISSDMEEMLGMADRMDLSIKRDTQQKTPKGSKRGMGDHMTPSAEFI